MKHDLRMNDARRMNFADLDKARMYIMNEIGNLAMKLRKNAFGDV
jgi:hypothetical protein